MWALYKPMLFYKQLGLTPWKSPHQIWQFVMKNVCLPQNTFQFWKHQYRCRIFKILKFFEIFKIFLKTYSHVFVSLVSLSVVNLKEKLVGFFSCSRLTVSLISFCCFCCCCCFLEGRTIFTQNFPTPSYPSTEWWNEW